MVVFSYKELLKRVRFPVYKLPSENYYYRDGILLLNEKVIDDRNQPGAALGIRRLQTPHKVYNLRTCYEEFIDLVNETPSILIDSKGLVFSYKKTKNQKVLSYRIHRKEILDTHTRIWVKGINFCFIVKEPNYGKEWVQILHLNNLPWLLYSLSEDKLEPFRRKI